MAKDNEGNHGTGMRSSKFQNAEVANGESRVSRRAVVREGVVIRDGKEIDSKEALYEGTVRVVTEADIAADSRLVAASVVAGQLYDFSNLPHIPEGSAEANVESLNEAKAEADEERVIREGDAPVRPAFTSANQRREMGIESKEEMQAREKTDEEAWKRVEERRATERKARVGEVPQGQGRSAREAVQRGK